MRLIPQRRWRISFGSAFALLIGLLFAAGHAYAASVPKMAAPTLTGGERQISLTWSHPAGVPGLQAYRIRYREKGRSAWTYADARSDSGEQNFYGHETSATIPAHESFTMKDDTTYEVEIRAGKWDGGYDGWGAWSDTAEATTLDPALTASDIDAVSATLTIDHYTGNWRHKQTAPTTGTCSAQVTGTTASLTDLASNTSYTWKAYSDSNCATQIASVTFITTTPLTAPKMAAPTLTGGERQISLTWSYPAGVPGLQAYRIRYREKGRSAWTYADARSDSGEQNFYGHETSATIPAHESFTMKDDTTYEVEIRAGKWDGGYDGWGAWSDTAEATTLGAGVESDAPTAAQPADEAGAADGGTQNSATLTVSNVESRTATLTIAGHTGNWHYKYTSTSTYVPEAACSPAVSGTSTNLTKLYTGSNYTFKAYSDSDCSTELATASSFLTKPGQMHEVQVAAKDKALLVSARSTRIISSFKVQWKSGTQDWDSTRQVIVTQGIRATITGLVNGTEYTVRTAATNASGDGPWSVLVTGTPVAQAKLYVNVTSVRGIAVWFVNHGLSSGYWYYQVAWDSNKYCYPIPYDSSDSGWSGVPGTTLTVSVYSDQGCKTAWPGVSPVSVALPGFSGSNIGATTATLAISNYTGNWYYSRTGWGCSSVVTTGSTAVSNLTPGTQYTFEAWRTSLCRGYTLGKTSFPTLPPQPATPTVASGSVAGELTLSSSVTGTAALTRWEYKKNEGTNNFDANWTTISSTSNTLSHTVTGLSASANYQFKVRAVNASGAGAESVASTAVAPEDETLTVSAISTTGATLTIGKHSGNWYYKHASGTCSPAVTTTSTTVSSLTANTSYTFTAYSDSKCATELAAASAFPTLPPKAAKPTVAKAGSGKLALSSSVTGTAALTRWEYRKKEGNTWDSDWTQVTSASTTLSHTVTNLTNATGYQFEVRAVNASGTGAKSDVSTTVAPAAPALTATSVTQTGATLTLSNWTAAWWHNKTTGPGSASCTSVAANTTTASLSGLTINSSYTWAVYSASDCASANKIVDADFSTSAATLAASAVKETTATLTISGTTAAWWYKGNQSGAQCTSVAANTATASLSGLTGGTDYTYKAYSNNTCATEITTASTDAEFSTVGLTAGSITQTGATLTLSNWTAAWWHNKTTGPGSASCTSVAANTTTASLSGLTINSSYTWAVYSASDCASANKIVDADFSTSAATLAASAVKETTATLTISGTTAAWWYKGNQSGAQCTSVAANTATASLSGLTGGTDYTYKAYSNNTCATEITTASTDAEFSTVGLTANPVAQTTATLNLANWTAAWWHKKTAPATPAGTCTSVAANTATASLSSLTVNSSYTWTVYSAANCNAADKIADVDFTTAAVSLAASAVKETTATLTLTGATAAWWYKRTAPTGDSTCHSVSANDATDDLTGLTGGTDYTYKAYSNNTCATEITTASTDAEFSTVGLTAGSLTRNGATLTLSNWAAAWWHNKTSGPGTASCTPVAASTTTASLSSLTAGSDYTWTVYSAANCNAADKIADVDFTTAAVTLTASAITRTSATLTLANYAGGWSYKSTAPRSPCNAIADGTTEVSLTELEAGTEYTYAAFSSSNCGPTSAEIARETFTTPKAATLTASDVEADSAKLTIDNHSGNWYYKANAAPDNSCKGPVSGTTKDLTKISSNTSYTYKAYSDSSCNTEITSASTDAEFLTKPGETTGVSADPGDTEIDVSWTAATGTVTGYKVQWKSGNENYDDTTRQATPASASHTITGLTNDTEYTLRVAAVNNTGDGAWSDEAGATPKAVTLTATNVAQTTATLKIAGYTKAWAFSRTDNSDCTAVTGASEKNVTGLTKKTEYTYHAFSGTECVTSLKIAEHTFTTLDSVTLTASLTGADTATLTIANYAPNWYYKADAAPDNTCQGPVSGTTRNLKSLAGNTNYTYKAYRDSSCSTTALASASEFLTKPGKPTTLTVSNGAGSGKLTLSASVTGDGQGGGTTGEVSRWDYQQSESGGSFGSWTEISSTSKTLSHTVTGLTDGTDYQFKVRAVNDTGTGPSSDASDAAAPVDGIPSFGNNTIADQTYVKDQPIETLTLPAASGGDAPLTYALTPALPKGLTFDASTRMISGTPTGLQAETTYTYTVTDDDDTVTDDDDDTATLNFKLTVIASASVETPRGGGGGGSANRKPAFGAQTIPDQTWLQGLVFEPLVLPEASGGDGTLTYTLEPALPQGVTFDASTRVLSGLPETPLAPTRYTYKATDRDGDAASLTFTLTVLASGAQDRRPAFSEDQRVVGNGKLAGHVPPDAQGAGATTADLNYAQNTAIEPTVLPAAEAGDGTLSYTLEPALPQGMTFDADTRVLSGTPATQAAPTLYTYTATDEDGDRATLVFTLAVAADLQPAFGPGATLPDLSYEQRAVIEPLTLPAATGGDGVLSYALQPALPQGLSFDATTRVLSGTPATRMKAARYTYTVTDADGDTASLYFRLAATPSARARAEQSVLTDGLASQGRAVLGSARRALDGRFRDADQAVDLSVLRANWSSWQERLSAAAKGSSGNNPGATGGGLDLANAWGQTSSMPPHEVSGGLSPETPGSAGDASLTPLPGVFGLSGLAGTCGTAALDETPWPNASDSRVDNGWDDGACNGAASIRLSDWLWGRRYALRLNGIFGNADDDARAGPDWTLWSAGDQRRIEGTPGNNRYETDWRSMHLGLDARFNSDWLAGVVVSRGWGETGYGYEASGVSGTGGTGYGYEASGISGAGGTGYGHAAQGLSGTGELETDVWTALPYLHGRLGGFEVWGLAGGGWGEISATRSEGEGIKEDSHLNLWLGAVGASKPLLGIGPLSLSFVADAGLTHMTTNKGDGNSALDGLEATTQQVRLGLAGEYEASLFDGQAELTPFWQLNGRYDGGDGLAGAGLEAQAGLRYRSERLSLVAQGHWLGMHSETGYREYGASMEARVSPLAHGRGLTLALAPRWGANGALSGASADGGGMGTGANSATGIGALWDTDIVRRAAIANTQAAGDDTAHVWSVDAEVGYGLWLPYQLGLLTPFSEMRLAGGHEQRQRLGLRLDAGGAQTPGGLQLELTGFRASTHLETDTGVNLNATLNY